MRVLCVLSEEDVIGVERESMMTVADSANRFRSALASHPRFSLATLPTPLEDAPRLSEKLGVRILFKHDDQTGLAMGGNKARKLEFLLADALRQGADSIITTGGPQSNHARLTAAACCKADLECYLVLDPGLSTERQGNLLLDELFGAHLLFVEDQDPASAIARMERLAAEMTRAGKVPYVIPRGGSVPVGALGYAAFVPELIDQLEQLQVVPTHLYLATGSTGTHSGTLAGLVAVGSNVVLQGVSVSRDRRQQTEKVRSLTDAVLSRLGLEITINPGRIEVEDRFRGPGYGIPTEETFEAIELVARSEAVILDPVYTGKAMAGLISHAREGQIDSSSTVVFVHTGGAPALFAYSQQVMTALHVGAR